MNDNSDDLAARLRRSLDSRGGAPELPPELVADAASRPAPRMIDQRRRLQIAGGMGLAVAAVAVGALVLPSAFPRAPLFVAASDGRSAALGATEDSISTDLRIGPWIDYQYVAGDGLSTAGGSGTVYQLRRAGSAEDVLRNVAGVLGLDGDPVESEYSEPAYPSFVIGPEDGSAASVVVSWSGTGNWWYNDPAANPPFECAVSSSDGGDDAARETEPCIPPEPTVADSLAPSEADARTQARAIFAATGLDVAADDIRVTADAWQTVATASLRVDGVQTAIDWSVAWSSTGEISWAYGHSIEVVARGDYGTVSAAAVVERLTDWRWYGAAGPDYQGGMVALAADALRAEEAAIETPATDPDAPVESPEEPTAPEEPATPEEPTAPDESPAPDPAPEPTEEPGVEPTEEPGGEPEPLPEPSVEPEPVPEEPEVVVVTVEEAESTLLLMWDAEGNAWLVPGFAIQHPDGWWNTVVSLVAGVIELPAPMEIEPLIDETVR